MCRSHAAVRQLLGGILEEDTVTTIVDMEAGLEHLSRGTGRHVDTLVVMMEPYYRALETARRTAELGGELGIDRVVAVANKIRDDSTGTPWRPMHAPTISTSSAKCRSTTSSGEPSRNGWHPSRHVRLLSSPSAPSRKCW